MQMKIYTMHKKKHYFRKENRSGPGPDLDRPQGPGQEVAGPGPLYRGPGQRSLARTLSVAAAPTVSQLSADSRADNQPVGRQLSYSSLSGCGCGCSACTAGSRQL